MIQVIGGPNLKGLGLQFIYGERCTFKNIFRGTWNGNKVRFMAQVTTLTHASAEDSDDLTIIGILKGVIEFMPFRPVSTRITIAEAEKWPSKISEFCNEFRYFQGKYHCGLQTGEFSKYIPPIITL